MKASSVPVWKKIPFLRILIPFLVGILMQSTLEIPVSVSMSMATGAVMAILLVLHFSLFQRYRFYHFNGIFLNIFFAAGGAILTWQEDIRNNRSWIGVHQEAVNGCFLTLEEPPVEKPRSFKALASAEAVVLNEESFPSTGKVILYFKKNHNNYPPDQGTTIFIRKPLQLISGATNPGGFNFQRYSLYQGITHQLFLDTGDYRIVREPLNPGWKGRLYQLRDWVLSLLRQYIPGDEECGLAEALLIGYKDDLDKTLVQSYANTGVVHIIAISGLHLGLIYCLLVYILKPMQKRKSLRWLRPLLIIGGLWIFSLLAGAQPSVLRSAVMFSCLVLGESWSRRSSTFNTLAFSAFILLCYNPYWLWDTGFQLSYSAVVSILVFMKPVYQLFYFPNKLVDLVWKMNAVTIAAQLMTLPVSIYYFHQFPNYFLLTNFVAVPFSSAILLGELLLCCIPFFPAIATLCGKLISWLIHLMNSYIIHIESLPFSLWKGLQIDILQTILFYVCLIALSTAWLRKSMLALKAGLLCLLLIFLSRSLQLIKANQQQLIIVYHAGRRTAIDIVTGRQHYYLTDSIGTLPFLEPARTLYRCQAGSTLPADSFKNRLIRIGQFMFIQLDRRVYKQKNEPRLHVDLMVLTRNARLSVSQLNRSFRIGILVADGSVSPANRLRWAREADSLHIPFHDVSLKGAFVKNLR